MTQKYIIKMECTKTALAELIALGLEQHASITQIEVMKPEESKPVEAKPVQDATDFKISFKHKPAPKSPPKRHTHNISGWEVYELLIKNYHPQKTFRTGNIFDLSIAIGFRPTRNSISSHLSKMTAVGLLERCGGDPNGGFVYRMTPLRSKKDFIKAMSGYNNKAKIRENEKSKRANRWFNLAELQMQHQ